MKRFGACLLLVGFLTACDVAVVSGGAYVPISMDSLEDPRAITTRWLATGASASVPVAIPSVGAEGSLLILMSDMSDSDPDTRIAASQLGTTLASSNQANVFVAGGSAFTPVSTAGTVEPQVIVVPNPPDENLYTCLGPCLALDPTAESGIVTFSVVNEGPPRLVNLYAAWIDEGDVTEPGNDVRGNELLRTGVGDSVLAAIETLGDVDWFEATASTAHEIVTPEELDLRVSIYYLGGSTGIQCDLARDTIYAFASGSTAIQDSDDIRIASRYGDAGSYFGGEYEIRTVASTSAQVPSNCRSLP